MKRFLRLLYKGYDRHRVVKMSECLQHEYELKNMRHQLQQKDEIIAAYQKQNDEIVAYYEKQMREHITEARCKQAELEALRELLSDRTSNAQQRRQKAIQKIRQEYYRKDCSSSPMYQQEGYGIIVCDGKQTQPLIYDEDIIDSLVEPMVNNVEIPQQTEGQLQCARCQKVYSVIDYIKFLKHVNELSCS